MSRSVKELIHYVTDGRFVELQRGLTNWAERCPRIMPFFDAYANKVRKKIRNAAKDGRLTEDLKDVLFELEIAYFMLCNERFEIEYEKYRDGPDYTVTFAGQFIFNIEVKRIREAEFNDQLNLWREKLHEKVRRIPSSLGLSLSHRTLNINEQVADRLQKACDSIFQFIEETIHDQNGRLPIDGSFETTIPGFERDLEITLTKPSGKSDDTYTSIYGGTWPLYYKNEIPKFIGTVCEKLMQLITGMPNILVLNSDSSTHDDYHLIAALKELQRQLSGNDDDFFRRKGFKDANAFLEKARSLTGIVFRSKWIGESADRNFLWLNNSADYNLPEHVVTHLKTMGS